MTSLVAITIPMPSTDRTSSVTKQMTTAVKNSLTKMVWLWENTRMLTTMEFKDRSVTEPVPILDLFQT